MSILITSLFYFAYQKYKAEKNEHCLGLIVIAGVILRLFISCDFYLHEWDERFHALVAKNLIDHPFTPLLYAKPILDYNYKNWAANHVWLHKQPVPLYAMAFSMWIFGKNVIALRLPSILLSTLAIISTYKLGELLNSKQTGIIAAFLLSINGLILEQTGGRVATDHIDIFFLSLISIACYFLLSSSHKKSKFQFIAGSIFTGLAILTKWLPALIVYPLWVLYSIDKLSRKGIIIKSIFFFLTLTIIVLPWQLYITHYFPSEAAWEYAYNKKHLFEVLGPHGQPFYFHFIKMGAIFGELIYLPIVWLIYKIFMRDQLQRNLILFIWIFIPYLFFAFAKTKMQGYILFCAPALFILTALFIFELKKLQHKNFGIVMTLLFLLLPIRYCIERVKPFSNQDRTKTWITDIKQLDKINATDRKVIFNCAHPIQAMFFTDFTAYDKTPSIEKITELHNQGYIIYMDDGFPVNLPKEDIPFVKYINE